MADTLDVSRLIDERQLSWFNWEIVIFCFFIILFDGYDIGTVGVAGPSLIKAWGIQSMAALSGAFSAGLFGILFGSPIFGWIGDRYGRVLAIVGSCMVIGVFTLATMWAYDLTSLTVLRFFTGIGIGGMLPNVIALNAEYAPKRMRATMIIIMFTGITFGGGMPGPVGQWLVPTHGWQVLFLIGGVLPIVIGLAAWVWLPESLKHLVLKTERRDAVARIVGQLNPALKLAADTRFTVTGETVYAQFKPQQLFQDGLRWITPLLWLCFICNLMSFYFLNTWLPTVLAAAHIPSAALSLTVFQVGGTLGGLVLSRPIDKSGLMPVCGLFVLSLIIAPFLGYAVGDTTILMGVIFLAGFTLLGLQFGLNATSAMIYPTSIRSNGSGWAFAVGRVGSASGPIFGGFLLDMHPTIQHLYLVLLIPLAIGTVASFILARLYYVRFQGMGLGRRDAIDAAAH